MGHTTPSQRTVIESTLKEFETYGRSLRKEEQEIYKEMLERVYARVGNISFTGSVHVWKFILLSLILDIELKKKTHDTHRCICTRKQDSNVV